MSIMLPVYRVQAADGRGPFRPGFTRYWVAPHRPPEVCFDDIFTAFGRDIIARMRTGFSYGCACRTMEGLRRWFLPEERAFLESVGFMPVCTVADLVLAENADQLVFGRRLPLHEGVIPCSWEGA